MALTIKRVGGQLAAAKTTLYTATSSGALLHASLVNENAAARTVNLYIHDGTASRRITPVDLSIAGGEAKYITGPWFFESGDLIEGDASVAADVDFLLSILEKS
jgi:hypothetical protein